MTQSQQVRLQSDIVDEIEKHNGGSFSEKFRAWKNAEIIKRIENLDSSTDSLTQEQIKKAVENAMPSGAYR